MKCNFLYMALILVLFLLCIGCASNYHTIKFDSIAYSYSSEADSVEIASNTYPMTIYSNQRYSYYMYKRDVSVIAVKVRNVSNQPVTLNDKSLKMFDGKDEIQIVDLPSITKSIHQGGFLYMLWSILIFNIYITHEDGSTSVSPPIPLGFCIGLSNTLISYNADRDFHKQMNKDNLIGKTIEPNQEVTGLIGVKGMLKSVLLIKYIPENRD